MVAEVPFTGPLSRAYPTPRLSRVLPGGHSQRKVRRGGTPTADQLEIVAHGATAILATWLGLTVITRARGRPGSAVFGLLCAYLVAWSVAVIVQRLTDNPAVIRPMNALENIGAYMLPAGTLHISLALAVEGRRSTLQQAVLTATYVLCAVVAAGGVFFPEQQLNVTPPHFELPWIPGAVFGWAWIGARIAIFGASVTWILAALRVAGQDDARRRQLLAALATVAVGATGGVIRIVPGLADTDPWIGVTLVTVAMALAAYAVFAAGLFLAPDVAGRAFRYSLISGLAITVLVAALIGADWVTQRMLGINLPILSGLALVFTIALIDPVTERFRRLIGTDGDAASDRLLRALGRDIMTAQRPDRAIGPALARLRRAFALGSAAVHDPIGAVVASDGPNQLDAPQGLRLPLTTDGVPLGSVLFGPKRNGLPFTHREVELLGLAAGYLAASLNLAGRQDQQERALTALGAELAEVESRGSELSRALVSVNAVGSSGIHVFALGALRAERGSDPIRQWGGAKAGTRQAEAIFAFLFDRGERGASKDEIVELIWPDVEMERADLAFHRTLGGLRSTLEPARRGRDRGDAITFANDRYRLDRGLIEWSDVVAFEERIAAVGSATDPSDALADLERARSLYRGDYLDDCPFYGDSEYAEERRLLLRGRMVDLLLELGERYAARGDRPAAAGCFRQANLVAGEQLPRAVSALGALGSPA